MGWETARRVAVAPEHDLAGALHEVSNALTVVLGWIETAKAASAPDTDASRALDVAASRARQAHHIVRRAIGAETSDDAPTTIAPVIADAVVGLEPAAARAGVTLRTSIDASVESVILEGAGPILQILTNLLLNAIGVSPRAGVVTVDVCLERRETNVGSSGSGVVIGVADEGPGVPPERRMTLLESGISTRPGGAGIGLRHAAGLARSAGGALALVGSERGARFELTWPSAHADPPVSVSPVSRISAALAGARILIIEDDDAVIDLLDTALSARGADVVSVKRRTDLGKALATGTFDAALFDISPIQEDVAGALMAVQGSSPLARLIVISGSAESLPSLPDGCDPAWVRKPFEVSEIVRALAGR